MLTIIQSLTRLDFIPAAIRQFACISMRRYQLFRSNSHNTKMRSIRLITLRKTSVSKYIMRNRSKITLSEYARALLGSKRDAAVQIGRRRLPRLLSVKRGRALSISSSSDRIAAINQDLMLRTRSCVKLS